MPLLLKAQSKADFESEWMEMYGTLSPVQTDNIVICVKCNSIIVGGNYKECLCGAPLPYVEIPGGSDCTG